MSEFCIDLTADSEIPPLEPITYIQVKKEKSDVVDLTFDSDEDEPSPPKSMKNI